MSTIYVVMKCYEFESDYPYGVFSTRENAEAWMEWCLADQGEPSFDSALFIEEWPLDEQLTQTKNTLNSYGVHMRRSGAVEYCNRFARFLHGMNGPTEYHLSPRWTDQQVSHYLLDCRVWAPDERSARQMAQVERLRLIEAGEWQEDLI